MASQIIHLCAAIALSAAGTAVASDRNPNGADGGDTTDAGRQIDRGPAPESLTITSMIFAGSGCRAGSVAQNVAADHQAFTLLFDNYQAQVGPGIPFREKRKNCQLSINFDYPEGWSFGLVDLDVRGYAALDPDVSGEQNTAFYWQGSTLTGNIPFDITGPYDDNYASHATIPVGNIVWSDCGTRRALNINTSVKMLGTGQGLMTVDSLDGQVTQIYGIEWRRCP